ncbi:hypothetical protein [Burkholderia sp. Bp8991]|uniref:hypothetical protein n=1 Tax=Burkholderia sp. Bp8991 TaxID=2184553 RepID=UPI000F5A3338|nr:hypothetical protein [Burkholderia sp. Bp8991]
MRKLIRSWLGLVSILAGLGAAPGAWATTTLTFDDVSSGTILTNQYQNLGVTASGVIVVNAGGTPWTANTPTNIAAAPTGLMTFTLNPAIIGNVQTISAYVGPSTITTISAYDASSALVGQTVVPASSSGNMTPASVTSSGNPIVTVQIQGGGSAYAIDTLTFITDVSFAKYAATVYLAPKVSYFSATETFTLGVTSTGINPATQPVILKFGALTLTIPARSFLKDQPPRGSAYVFQGTVNGGSLYVSITPTKTPNTYQLFALGSGYAVSTGLSAMPVSLSIGDNDGSTNVTPNYVNHVPMSP